MNNTNLPMVPPPLPPIIGGSGGKGGGGGGRAATEAPNSLRSKQVAYILDMLGEGEWEGLIDGPGGIYVNDVQLFRPYSPTGNAINFIDAAPYTVWWLPPGDWAFQGVTVEFRNGTQGQSAIRKATTAGSVIAVNTIVTSSIPVTRGVAAGDHDIATVGITVNGLYYQNPGNGDLTGYEVTFNIAARVVGGSFVSIVTDTIRGKTMTQFTREYQVDLEELGAGPWEIKVTRLQVDDPTSNYHSEMLFSGIGLYTRERFRYPNSVLCGISIDASQVSSIPTRAYLCKMARVRVPFNYNPLTRVYTGVWDGTFKIAWTDNPAWCLYDMATNERYGLGEYFDEALMDKWTLYTIGQYCDQLVPDGKGGTEPRFTINAYFQASEEAITFIQNMASIFRGIIYYMGGQLVAVQDSPADPTYLFSPANVVDGVFSYAGASQAARHTVAMVVWNNPEISYKQDIEYVEDVDGLLKFGYRPVTVSAMGCTSRGQAHRLGLWSLYVEQNESDVVSFKTSLEGTGIAPGAVISVLDPMRAGIRLGGRVIDRHVPVTTEPATVTMDSPVAFPAGTHTVSYIGDDGSLLSCSTTTTAGTFQTLTVTGYSVMPSIGTLFGIQTATVVPQQFRILSISESEGLLYEITAVAHNPSKYAYIENGLTLVSRPTSISTLTLPAISNPLFTERLYLLGDESVGVRLVVSWDQEPLAMGYMFSWRKGSENWSSEKLIDQHEITFNPVAEGWDYSFRIQSISILGKRGLMSELTYTVLGEKIPPPPFDYFTCLVQPDGTRQFDFGYTVTEKPIDFKGARIRYVQGVSSNWDDMAPLENEGFFPFSPLETNQLLSGTYTIAARAEDRTKNQSTSVFIQVTLPDRRLGTILAEFDESDNIWSGVKTSCHSDIANNIIEANDSVTWTGLPGTWAAWARWNTTPASPIVYETIARDMVSAVSGIIDVNLIAAGTSVIELATSADGTTWSAWGSVTAPFTARYFKLRVTVTATGGFPVAGIQQLIYRVGGKVKVEVINDINIAALTGTKRIGVGDIRVPFSNTYVAISRVTVAAIQDANPGWTWLLVDRNLSLGPRIKFYKNGVLADPALVDFYLEGY